MQTTTTEMAFNEPYTPNPNTTAVSATRVAIYTDQKWMELEPNANFASGLTSLVFNNFKNMPFEIISVGITFLIHTWIDGDVREIITFTKTINALPHPFTSKIFIPTPVLKSQPYTFELTFKPYNYIPSTGLIEIQIPNCGLCDFTI